MKNTYIENRQTQIHNQGAASPATLTPQNNTLAPEKALPSPATLLRELTAAFGKDLKPGPVVDPPPASLNGVRVAFADLQANEHRVVPFPCAVPPSDGESPDEKDPRAEPTTTSAPAEVENQALPGLPASTLNGHTRNGKIARLPLEIREHVNQMLRAGRTYKNVIDGLNELGYPGLNTSNISAWKHGGHVDWLREQQQLEARLALPKALERCTRSGEIDRIQQNALLLAADKFMIIISQIDHHRAVQAVYDKPELLPKYITAMTAMARCATELARAFDLCQNREAFIREQSNLESPQTDLNKTPAIQGPVKLIEADSR